MATASESNQEKLEPKYATDDNYSPDLLRVSVIIPDLEVSRRLKTSNLRPKIVRQPDNATVDVSFTEKSFTVTVTGSPSGPLKNKHYLLNIRQLPKCIEPQESYHEVKDGRILVFLKKQVKESWYPELESGLDMYEEEDHTGDT